jgi:hypothetical protein
LQVAEGLLQASDGLDDMGAGCADVEPQKCLAA